MQVNKKDGNRYVKELDKIDLYLLNMMKRFFNADTSDIKETAESIILEAVKRAKDEIVIDNDHIVLKIVTLSGEAKYGIVTLVPEDIGAEHAIMVKHTAFNKSFGSKADTVCEGDDPRLDHEHAGYVKIDDINTYIDSQLKAKGLIP